MPTRDAAIRAAVRAVHQATADADTASLRRAQAVARLVEACDGNQSEAARLLELHQTTVNKLVLRAKRAAEEQTRPVEQHDGQC